MSSEERRVELLQGSLDLIVLRALATMGPLHAYAIATRLEQISDYPLDLNQGTLYPALVRLEQKGWINGSWGKTENNREAKFYTLTKAGKRALTEKVESWRRLAGLVDKLLLESERNVENSSLVSSALGVLSRTPRRGRSRAGNQRASPTSRREICRGGMSPEEARFAAKRAFGNIEQTKELQRDERSFRWLTGWAMELRLGVRMLVRYPGLTVVGGLAMAFAILVGAGVFEVVKRATDPVLPLPDGEDIVGLTYWDRMENVRRRASSYDFLTWREQLTTLKNVGASGCSSETSLRTGELASP